MRSSTARLYYLAFCLVVLIPGISAAGSGDKNWQAEVGTVVSHRDNFFFRADDGGTPAPSATLTTIYANAEVELDSGKSRWTLGGEAAGSFTDDIDNADYQTAGLEVEYKRHKTRGSIGLGYLPNRIYSEEADGVFFDLTALELGIRRDLKPGMWLGLEYGRDDWSFDPSESDRDATSEEISLALRVPLGSRVGVRLFALAGQKDANAPDYDWDGYGYGLALEWNPSERVSLFARAKARERDYENAPAGDNNFDRSDTIVDGLINLQIRIGKLWGLRLMGRHRNGESTRVDRNYDANEAGFALFFAL